MPIKPIILRTLGTAQVDIGQVQIRPNAVRRFAALLYLSAEAGRRVPRRCLIDLLFPDQTERNGLHSLRELVYQLKTAGVGLEADQEGIELPSAAVRADYTELLTSERLTMDQIRAAQGGLLPGYSPHGSEAFKEWFEPFRARTISGLSRVLLRDHDRAREVANLEMAEAAARGCLAVAPLNELAVKALAETMAIGGAMADALRLLDEYGAEIGGTSPELGRSTQVLKRRIGERVQGRYRPAGELPFVGRDAEMLELNRRWVASLSGSTQRLIVVGEAGIGKTRLVNEFAALAGIESRIVRLTIQPYDRRRPMGVLVDLVPMLLQLPGAIGISPESMDALTRLTLRHSAVTAGQSAVDDPEIVSRAITHALDDLLSAVTSEGHVTLILEDAQWADPLSLQALAQLSMEDRCLLVISTTRQGATLEFGARFVESAAVIALPPLDQTISTEVARRALLPRTGGAHQELHTWMADIANGNPLFISLLVAHFLATGTAFAVPGTVHDLIGKSLDALDPAATTILQTCVLLGSASTLPRIVEVLDLPYIEAVSGVSRLHEQRVVKFVDEKLQANHDLLAEALLHRTPQAVRCMLHMRIAAVLETELRSAESTALLWHCAEHWVAAGEHGRALSFLRRCAEHTNSIGRPGAAAEILVRAASLQIGVTTQVELLREAVLCARAASELGLILKAVEQLRRRDPAVRHDDVELAELHAISVSHRDSDDCEARLMSCVASEDSDADHRVRAGLAALQYSDTYSKPELAEYVHQAIRGTDLAQVDQILALQYRLVYHAVYGDPILGASVARELMDLARSLTPARAAAVTFNAVIAFWRAGSLAEAIEACAYAYTLASGCGLIRLQFASSLQMAAMLIDQGRFSDAQPWRERTRHIHAANEHLLDGIELRALEVDFCLVEGMVAEAEVSLRQADEMGLFDSPSRMRWRRSLAARLRQLGNGPKLDEEEIAELIGTGSGLCPSTGIRDIEMAVIVAALSANGEQARANDVLTGFLKQRSEHFRGPLARQLQNAIAQAGLHPLESNEAAVNTGASVISP